MEAFVLNSQGRLVFPENFWPDLDFTVFETLTQFETVIRRDFEAKAPTGADILSRVESDSYSDRHELLRDLTLNLMWVNRYAMTMYEKRPMRWRDVPRHRDDVFLPVLTPWEEGERKISAVQNAYRELPAAWDAEAEDRVFELVFHVFRNRKHHATELPAIKPTVAEILAEPGNRTFHLPAHDPDHRLFSYQEIVDCYEEVPELEALHRRAMVLNNQYPWDVSQTRLTEVRAIEPDDFVVLFVPRNEEVMAFIRRVKENRPPRRRPPAAAPSQEPVQPYPPVEVRKSFRVMPRVESLTAIKGEHACSNEDLIRNAGYNWSPMSVAEIATFSLLNGVVYGLLLFMLSSGLTLIFSLMGVLNFAHASFFMLGAYLSYQIGRWVGFWPALVLAPFVCGLLGAAVERYGLRRVHQQGHVAEILFTFGLAYVIAELVIMAWGRNPIENIRNTSPSCASVSIVSASLISVVGRPSRF